MGLPQRLVDRLRSIELVIADIDELVLATAVGSTITVDRNAAGHGWFVDVSADLDEEFSPTATDAVLTAIAGTQADGKIDLLTALLHEQAHILGVDHSSKDAPESLMSPTLSTSTRRKLTTSIIDQILANNDW